MRDRKLSKKIRTTLRHSPACALLGPRQVGKTTLAQSILDNPEQKGLYLDLEDPADRSQLVDPDFYFSNNHNQLIIIDEVQRMPNLFEVLRSRIDQNRRLGHNAGQFLLLGSASQQLLSQSSESLAGRIAYLELFPFNLTEIGAQNMTNLWLHGGFPEAYLNQDFSAQWRDNFIKTYLERDIPSFGSRVPAETLRRFWIMLAHQQGQTFNASQLGSALNVSGQAVSRYLDLMVDLMLIRRLPSWQANVGKRLTKSPKTYVRDSGILHSLLNINSLSDLLSHPVVGLSWEGFVIENIISVLPNTATPYFYRTSGGAEVDLLLDFGSEQWAIEIKKSTAPKLTKGFHHACADLNPARKFIVYMGEKSYLLPEDITVASLIDLMEEIGRGT